jgi:uncharacterized membrane protein
VNVDVTTDTVIDRPIAGVASFATDPGNAPKWYANIRSVEWETPPPVAPGSRMAFVATFLGRTLSYTYEVTELVPEQRLVMRTAEGPFPTQTTYTWEALGADQTRMTLRNTGEPQGFARLGTPVVTRAMRRAMTKDLAMLKQVLEAR